MSEIKVLDENLINKIAAGEVVERPSSIVKELVENSIDSGATEIVVEIEKGGIQEVKVIDNGKGIIKEDIPKAFLRHATSKIKTENDLFRITSLGFRGEALASIASVSEVEIITRTKTDDWGYKAIVENGNVINIVDQGAPVGTTITVKNIFYNVPARLKFLKSETREQMYITDLMENYALSHPQIAFKYIANKKLIFLTKGDGNLKNVIYTLYGKNTYENLIEVNCSKETITLKGFVGNSKLEKSNRNYQSLFVNGRIIKNKTITAAIESAYKSMLSINKFPLYVLQLLINPEFIDVNVHPTKAEIKFEDEQKIFKEVYSCIKDALINKEYIPTVEINYSPGDINNAISSTQTSFLNDNENKTFEVSNLYKTIEKNQSIFETVNDNNYNVNTYKQDIENNTNIFDYSNKISFENVSDNFSKPILNKYDSESNNLLPKMTVIGQIHFMYIATESIDSFYLIDQHAAHERILYEKYFNEFNDTGINKQILLTPYIIELSINEKDLVLQNIHLFNDLGFEIEDFGGTSISLRTIPNNFINKNYKEVIEELVANIQSYENDRLKSIDKIIYTLACKNAIKAGDKLNIKEMYSLIEQLRFCNNPFTCPHGRPTMIKFSYVDLEKKFKRIM
ncbi:MAG: DNA mismatch repair endonuclease MutL [Clostridiales bacterium]|nr:DNA mismatch repair endonuclease MutL [Clostridiales bacterium]